MKGKETVSHEVLKIKENPQEKSILILNHKRERELFSLVGILISVIIK